MLRLTEVRLPLDHSDEALHAAIIDRLGVDERELLRYSVFRRAVDARRRSAIALTYTLDVELGDESLVKKIPIKTNTYKNHRT